MAPKKHLKKKSSQKNEQPQDFMANMCKAYSALRHVFRYLKVQDLLQAARVCHMWHDLATQPPLWQTVRLQNCRVTNWKAFTEALQRRGTEHLELHRTFAFQYKVELMWNEFAKYIGLLTSLTKIDLCACPSCVVEYIPTACPQLKVINARFILSKTVNLSGIARMQNLEELRLQSMFGISADTAFVPLKQRTNLTNLSLTSFKNLVQEDFKILGELKALVSLEFGECCAMPEDFGLVILPKLGKLKKLRLEQCELKPQVTLNILHGVRILRDLTHLELLNFDVVIGFDEALAKCNNIRRLLIIPTHISRSATASLQVMNGVIQLSNTLEHFVWVIATELVGLAKSYREELIREKNKGIPKKYISRNRRSQDEEFIPVLNPAEDDPISRLKDMWMIDIPSEEAISVEDGACNSKKENMYNTHYVPLKKLLEFLSKMLPQTKVQILKIPLEDTLWQKISGDTS